MLTVEMTFGADRGLKHCHVGVPGWSKLLSRTGSRDRRSHVATRKTSTRRSGKVIVCSLYTNTTIAMASPPSVTIRDLSGKYVMVCLSPAA
jgi:hypothetical protein